MLPIRSLVSIAALLLLSSCVNSPPSRSPSESNLDVKLAGVAASATETITISAVDQNTGAPVPLGNATISTAGIPFTTSAGTHYTAFPWTFDAGMLTPNYWSPQTVSPDLMTAQGHLELFAQSGTVPFRTFSPEADDAVMMSGLDPVAAGGTYADGNSTVLFDQTGVGLGAGGGWVSDRGMVSMPPTSGFSNVAWSVGHYTVENGTKTIYGLICTPTSAGTHPVIVFNHGGIQGTVLGADNMMHDGGGNLTGVVTASGWTSQPANAPDSLGQCIDWAKRGWIFATSAYRHASVSITSSSPSFANFNQTSDGQLEFCLGEVTDILALTDLVMHHAGSIAVGGTGQLTTLHPNGKLMMLGYSHGGCNTWRAVEQGAPVTAVSVIEGFSDMRLHYLQSLVPVPAPIPTALFYAAAAGSGAYPAGDPTSPYLPDSGHVMGYNWRSAHYFAQRGDLSLYKFKAMPILILQGDIDSDMEMGQLVYNPVPLSQATLISRDILATNIFVGPSGVAPAPTQPCVSGDNGAALPMDLSKLTTCPVSYQMMPNACTGTTPPGLCPAIALPLTPAAGATTQQHYLIVYHNMNHTDGGLAIKGTLDAFVFHNFGAHSGCSGILPFCATD